MPRGTVIASIYDLKPRFQALLRPLVDELDVRGYTANQVTLTALGLSAFGGALIWATGGHWISLVWLPIILFVRMALNAIDGMLAREHNQASVKGMFLNELTDIGSDALLYLPLGVVAGLSPTLVGLVVAAGALTEVAGILAQTIGAERRYDGPFGKSDRAVFFGALAILIIVGLGGWWMNILLVAALVLALLTTINRCRAAMEDSRVGPA